MVSNTETENLILENNFENKLFKIPISVDYFIQFSSRLKQIRIEKNNLKYSRMLCNWFFKKMVKDGEEA